MTPPGATKAYVDVNAGVMFERPDPELAKRYVITAEQWEAAGDDPVLQGRVLAERNGEALGYAALLMACPGHLNWVHVEWVWL